MQLIFSFLICIIATTVGAISGIGGGVIIKPVLDAVSGLPVATISFLSGCTVLAMTIVSMLRSRGGEVQLEPRRGTLLAVGGAAGGVLGKMIFDLLCSGFPDSLVGVVQSILMIVLTGGILIYVLNRDKVRTYSVQNAVSCFLVGGLMGVLSAFLGIGGGPINLAILYLCFSMDTKTAALHSLYVILFSQITSFVTTFAKHIVPSFDPAMLILMVIGGIAGGYLGRSFSSRMTNEQVDRLFRWILVVITLISCYNLYHYAVM